MVPKDTGPWKNRNDTNPLDAGAHPCWDWLTASVAAAAEDISVSVGLV